MNGVKERERARREGLEDKQENQTHRGQKYKQIAHTRETHIHRHGLYICYHAPIIFCKGGIHT